LAASDAARLPTRNALQTTLLGITLPRVPVAAGENALLLVLAVLTLPEALTTGE
jgi:HPr kinase/phosphorylase